MHATTPRLRMLQTLFQHEVFVITPQLNAGSDCELGKIPLHKGMRGMVTQNRNKHLTVVNGRLAHVIQMEGNTLFLKLANENIVQMYPVSFPTDDGTIKTAIPLMPAYALTIPKAQGITVEHCIVWLDSPVVAPEGAYVALSRCRQEDNLRFMVPIVDKNQ